MNRRFTRPQIVRTPDEGVHVATLEAVDYKENVVAADGNIRDYHIYFFDIGGYKIEEHCSIYWDERSRNVRFLEGLYGGEVPVDYVPGDFVGKQFHVQVVYNYSHGRRWVNIKDILEPYEIDEEKEENERILDEMDIDYKWRQKQNGDALDEEMEANKRMLDEMDKDYKWRQEQRGDTLQDLDQEDYR